MKYKHSIYTRCIKELGGVYQFHLQRSVKRMAEQLGIEPPIVDDSFISSLIKSLPPRPPETDHYTIVLKIKKGMPPYPENFYWNRKLKRETISKAVANSRVGARKGKAAESSVLQKLYKLNDEELSCAIDNGVQLRLRRIFNYEDHIGRVLGDFVVVSLSIKEVYGVQRHIYTCKCTRCGAFCTRRAHDFLGMNKVSCPKCGVTRKSWRNSAYLMSNPYGRFHIKFSLIEDPGLDKRLLMSNYLSEYTVFQCTQGYMEAKIDASLLGLTDNDLYNEFELMGK